MAATRTTYRVTINGSVVKIETDKYRALGYVRELGFDMSTGDRESAQFTRVDGSTAEIRKVVV